MIGDVLIFLRDHLNTYLNAKSVQAPGGDTGEDKVVFVDGEKMDPITFLYKVKMIVFRDIDAAVTPGIKEKDLRMSP